MNLPGDFHNRRTVMAALTGAALSPAAERAAGDPLTVRISISESVIAGEVNENDARAAMLVWIRRISQSQGLAPKVHPRVFESPDRIEQLLKTGAVDSVGINLIEYRRMAQWLDQTTVFAAATGLKREYVLLVRSGDVAPTRLEQLRDKRLLALRAPSMCLAPAWIDNLVRPHESGGSTRFFSGVAWESKPSKVLLPVFFGHADACLTTSSSFSVMSELNPQVGKRLRKLAVSPEIVATLYAFRKGYAGHGRQRLGEALAALSSHPAGRQVLTMYQIEGLEEKPVSQLRESLAILEQAERASGSRAVGGGSP